MGSIIIQYDELANIWVKTHSGEALIEYVESLPTDTRRALLAYIRLRLSMVDQMQMLLEQEL